jgi:methyl-accepting chemotaxis protein
MLEIRRLFKMLFRPPTRSIGTKLFLILFGLVCFSVASVGLLSYNIARSAMIDQMQVSSQQTISLAGDKLDMKQQFFLNLSNQLISNSTFQEQIFQISNTSLSESEHLRRIEEIRGLLDQLALSDPTIRDITLFPLEDQLDPISTQREGVELDKELLWIKDIQQAAGEAVWLPILEKGYLDSAPKPLYAYGKLLGKNNIGSRDFVLLVQIEAIVIQEMIDDVKLSDGAETTIYDHSGKFLLSNKEGAATSEFIVPNSEMTSGYEIRENSQGEEELLAYQSSDISRWTMVGKAPLEELTGASKRIQTVTVSAIAASVVLTTIIGLLLVFMIGRPLGHMQLLMKQAANGNLQGRIKLRGKDEIGQVGIAYNQMMEQIGQLVDETRLSVEQVALSSSHIADAADQTATTAHEIHQASEQIAMGASGLANQAEAGSSQVEQLGHRLKEVLGLQQRMTSTSEEVNQACQEGGDTVDRLIVRTTETEGHFRNVNEQVNGLKKSAQSIVELLELMTELAKQTRVLSLNASIEASRSGSAGAGFRVIADEIRSLAERSNASITHVGDLTASIQGEVSSTVSAMTLALPFFQEMIGDVHAVHHLFEDVQNQMNVLITRLGDVTGSFKLLDETQLMLNYSMGEVSAVSEESSAASEQVASLCSAQVSIGDNLVELSEKLKLVSMKLEQQIQSFQV